MSMSRTPRQTPPSDAVHAQIQPAPAGFHGSAAYARSCLEKSVRVSGRQPAQHGAGTNHRERSCLPPSSFRLNSPFLIAFGTRPRICLRNDEGLAAPALAAGTKVLTFYADGAPAVRTRDVNNVILSGRGVHSPTLDNLGCVMLCIALPSRSFWFDREAPVAATRSARVGVF